jgi:Zn-dependent alcohol dehydrogenase
MCVTSYSERERLQREWIYNISTETANVVNVRKIVIKWTATCRKCAEECRLRNVAWCNLKGQTGRQTEGGRTNIKRKFNFINPQQQNGAFGVFIA